MFEGDTPEEQVAPALRWIGEHAESLPRYRLDDFGAKELTVRPKEIDASFRPRIWKEDILKPGTRRHRTKQVLLLALFAGFYGEELEAFVHRWISTRHDHNSNDVTAALRSGDRKLDSIRDENLGLIDALRHLGVVLKRLATVPLDVLQAIVDKAMTLQLEKRELFVTLEFAIDMYALAELLVWRSGSTAKTDVVSKKFWRGLHERYRTLRQRCRRLGLIRQATAATFSPGRPGEGKARSWTFPPSSRPAAANASPWSKVFCASGPPVRPASG